MDATTGSSSRFHAKSRNGPDLQYSTLILTSAQARSRSASELHRNGRNLGDRIAVRHTFRGTQTGPMGHYPASGKEMCADYLAIYRLADGKIAEA